MSSIVKSANVVMEKPLLRALRVPLALVFLLAFCVCNFWLHFWWERAAVKDVTVLTDVFLRPVRIHLDLDTNMRMVGKRWPWMGDYEVYLNFLTFTLSR